MYTDRVVVVTGTAGGVGLGIAMRLPAMGALAPNGGMSM
jgi:NAD(P)-dependent dehydrogenase (short-subunit alcohol dehydrogenase family)